MTIPVPRGKKDLRCLVWGNEKQKRRAIMEHAACTCLPTIFSRTDDFPDDCEPITTIWGRSRGDWPATKLFNVSFLKTYWTQSYVKSKKNYRLLKRHLAACSQLGLGPPVVSKTKALHFSTGFQLEPWGGWCPWDSKCTHNLVTDRKSVV